MDIFDYYRGDDDSTVFPLIQQKLIIGEPKLCHTISHLSHVIQQHYNQIFSFYFFFFVPVDSSSTIPTTGVRHANIICDGCKKSGLAGIRFRCGQCANYDLCASCYGDDVHDLTHEFIRYQTANSAG